MTPDNIKLHLRHFTGTEHYFKWSPLFQNFMLTDGAQFLAEKASAYWLMDLFASHLPAYREEGFATLTLTKTGDTAKAVITDGNNKVLAEQDIEWTSFPLDEIELWAEYNGEFWVILLPSEH